MTGIKIFRVAAVPDSLAAISKYLDEMGRDLDWPDSTIRDIQQSVRTTAAMIVQSAQSEPDPGELVIRLDRDEVRQQITLTHWRRQAPDTPDWPIRNGEFLGQAHDPEYQAQWTVPEISDCQPRPAKTTSHRDLRALIRISQSLLSHTDLNSLLPSIVNELVNTIGTERGTLYLLDEEKGELFSKVLLEDQGMLPEIRVRLGEGVSGYVAATGQVVNLADAYKSPYFQPHYDRITGFRTKSMLTVPMLTSRHRVIGVVQLLNKREGDFTGRDEELLSAMATQAAICIENNRLYQQELEQQRTRQALETARRIQQSFLPASIPKVGGLDLAGRCIYCQSIGGDYFDYLVHHRDEGPRLGVVVGDVCGHGLSSALLMATLRAQIRFRAAKPGGPGEIVNDVNKQFCQDTAETGEFVTLFYAEIDPWLNEVHWVRAGHDPGLVFDCSSGRFEELKGSGLALGLSEEFVYEQNRQDIDQGQVLVFGTDGIWETRNPAGEMYGKDNLKDVIRQNSGKSAREIVDAIERDLSNFREREVLEDDVTLVVVKIA